MPQAGSGSPEVVREQINIVSLAFVTGFVESNKNSILPGLSLEDEDDG